MFEQFAKNPHQLLYLIPIGIAFHFFMVWVQKWYIARVRRTVQPPKPAPNPAHKPKIPMRPAPDPAVFTEMIHAACRENGWPTDDIYYLPEDGIDQEGLAEPDTWNLVAPDDLCGLSHIFDRILDEIQITEGLIARIFARDAEGHVLVDIDWFPTEPESPDFLRVEVLDSAREIRKFVDWETKEPYTDWW